MSISNYATFESLCEPRKSEESLYKYINFNAPIQTKANFYDDCFTQSTTETMEKVQNSNSQKNDNFAYDPHKSYDFNDELFTELFFANSENIPNSDELSHVSCENEDFCEEIEEDSQEFFKEYEEIEFSSKEDLFKEIETKMRENKGKSGFVTIIKKIVKKTEKKPKKSYDYKNGLKIIGQKVISLIEKGFFEGKKENFLQKFLKESSGNIKEKITVSMMKTWINQQQIKKKYTKLRTFRDIWTRNSVKTEDFDEKKEVFKEVLTKITKKFLEEDVYSMLIANNSAKKIKKEEFLLAYMGVVPKMLKGIEKPEEFTSLG